MKRDMKALYGSAAAVVFCGALVAGLSLGSLSASAQKCTLNSDGSGMCKSEGNQKCSPPTGGYCYSTHNKSEWTCICATTKPVTMDTPTDSETDGGSDDGSSGGPNVDIDIGIGVGGGGHHHDHDHDHERHGHHHEHGDHEKDHGGKDNHHETTGDHGGKDKGGDDKGGKDKGGNDKGDKDKGGKGDDSQPQSQPY